MNITINIDGSAIIKLLLALLILGIIFNIARLYWGFGKDDTDGHRWYQRSGLRLYTDHGTGVEYVSTKEGNLVVRVGPDGLPHMSAAIRRELAEAEAKK